MTVFTLDQHAEGKTETESLLLKSAKKEVRLKYLDVASYLLRSETTHTLKLYCVFCQKNPTWTSAIPKPDNSTISPATYEQF